MSGSKHPSGGSRRFVRRPVAKPNLFWTCRHAAPRFVLVWKVHRRALREIGRIRLAHQDLPPLSQAVCGRFHARRTAMKLYGFGPTRSLRALWGLKELDADFEFVPFIFVVRDPR